MRASKFCGLLLGLTAVALLACSNQMVPAQSALDSIASALQAAETAGAAKYMPDEYGTAKAQLTDLKAAFDRKDYSGVLSATPGAISSIKNLATAAAAKKETALKELGDEWTELSASVPKLVGMVKARVDALGKRAPAGVDMDAVRTNLSDATGFWDKAQAAATAGNVEEAVNNAKWSAAKARTAATTLKLPLPAAG